MPCPCLPILVADNFQSILSYSSETPQASLSLATTAYYLEGRNILGRDPHSVGEIVQNKGASWPPSLSSPIEWLLRTK